MNCIFFFLLLFWWEFFWGSLFCLFLWGGGVFFEGVCVLSYPSGCGLLYLNIYPSVFCVHIHGFTYQYACSEIILSQLSNSAHFKKSNYFHYG